MIAWVAFLLAGQESPATDIQWGSSTLADNRDSKNDPLTEDWSFYLGYFDNGFVPTALNTQQWAANWETVQSAPYVIQGASTRFASTWENDGSATGEKAYIWGVNRQLADNEWILMRAGGWFFPSSGGIGFTENWFVSGVTEVVVGAANTGGIHMMTALVVGEPPALEYSQWQLLQFRHGELLTGPDEDEDGDGDANVVEFALASDATSSLSRPILGLSVDGNGRLVITSSLTRNASVEVIPQVGPDLINWQEGSQWVTVLPSSSTQLIFRDVSTSGPRFARMRFVLP